MKFIVEIDDFWLDEEQDLESGLRVYVIQNVISQIQLSIKDKIEKHITLEVKKQVEKSLYIKMNKMISEIVTTEKIKNPHGSDPAEITIKDHIKHEFQHGYGYRSPVDTIKAIAETFSKELKERYDLLFATQIIDKMRKNGFIKDSVVKKILAQ